ncbi:MAG: hypothetical protein Q9208_008300 [Pyrenodesmia sp. 3 TL-2023]
MPPKRQAPKHESDVLKRLKGNPQEVSMYNDIGKILCQQLDLKDSSNALAVELENARSKIRAQEEKNKDLQGQLRKSRCESAALSRENGDLKTDMFKLQPKNQISDAEIIDMYEGLRGQISSWVDGEVAAFIREWKETNSQAPSHSDVFRAGNSQADSEFLAAGHHYGGEYLAETLVLAHLHEALLREDLIFFGLSDDERGFFRIAARGLTNTTLSRGKSSERYLSYEATSLTTADPSVVRYIRSEFLKGFTESQTYQKRRWALASRLELEILTVVEDILPQPSDIQSRLEKLRDGVIKPALDLAAAIMTSATPYGFSRRMTPDTRYAHRAIQYRDLAINRCKMIDINTRGPVRVSKVPLHGSDETIAEEVLLLAPALLRRDPGRPEKTLTPERICVKMVQPAQAFAKPASTLAANLGLTKVDNKSQVPEEDLMNKETKQQTTATPKQKAPGTTGIPRAHLADVVDSHGEARSHLWGEERSAFPR